MRRSVNALSSIPPPAARVETFVTLHPPQDVLKTLESCRSAVRMVMLDPWYNKGVGGTRDDYEDWLVDVLRVSGDLADHVYVWGFPKSSGDC